MTDEEIMEEESEDTDAKMTSASLGKEDHPSVSLPGSDPIQINETASYLGESITRLVVLGGPQDSGKTTLISSLYEQFQRGAFANQAVRWSSTLLGLERISHEGRDSSGRTVPETLRTSRQLGRQVFHFQLWDEPSDTHQTLLIVDLSGEDFDDLKEFNDSVSSLGVLLRADHFSLLIAGDRILDPNQRHLALDETCMMLSILQQGEVLKDSTHVQVIVSKYDVLQAAAPNLKCMEFIGHLKTRIIREFGSKFASLSFYETIARDPTGASMPAIGIDALLEKWLAERRKVPAKLTPPDIPVSTLRRIDAFKGD